MALSALTTAAAQERPRITVPELSPDINLRRLPSEQLEAPPPDLPAVPSAPTAPSPPLGGEAVRFMVTAVVVDGVTVFDAETLQPLFAPVIGHEASLADLQSVSRAIEERYREDGYFLVRALVPAQTVEGGRVRILVVEGGIATVRLRGDIGPVADLLASYLKPVTEERPLRLATLERALLLVNDIPGISASGSLRPSPDEPGAADLTVTATRTPFNAAFSADNFGDDYTGRRQFASSVFSNSWTPLGERITLTGFATEPWRDRNQWVGQLATSWRPGLGGTFFDTIVSYGNSNPGAAVRDLDFDGRTFLAALGIGYPLIRTRALSVTIRAGIEYLNADTDVFDGEKFSQDRLRVFESSVRANFSDDLDGLNDAEVTVRQGLPILGYTRRDDEFKSTSAGTGQSTTVRGTVSRIQPLIGDLSVFGIASGQYSFTPLLSNEQFDLGGTNFGRGYDFDELAADHGVGATVELRYDLYPGHFALQRLQLFGFYEGGHLWSRNDVPEDSLTSAGGGIRLQPFDNTSIELQVAKPLTLDTERANGGRDPQFLFRFIQSL